jgi:uncharacterized membrane protein (DUF485 family)
MEDNMNQDIESLDRQRMRYMQLHLIGVAVAFILSLIRYYFRAGNLNQKPVGYAVLAGLFFSVLLMAFSTFKTAFFWRRIRNYPKVQNALNDEMVQNLEIQSWKAAFLGAVGTTLFFAVSSFFYPVCDPMLTALTSIIAGAGAYHASFYFRYRTL